MEKKNSGQGSEHDVSEWFVLKGELRFGPFSYADMVRMLQEKVIFGFDFGWHGGLSGWKRISDIADFQESAIRNLVKDPKAKRAIFAERKHSRHPHTGDVIIHDQQNWWKGQAFEISGGGVGIEVENTTLIPGQQIYLHFKPFENFPAFNAIGEIVSKRYVEDIKSASMPLRYGVRFVSVSGTGKEKLFAILEEKSA